MILEKQIRDSVLEWLGNKRTFEVEISNVQESGPVFDLTIVFKSGETYCCIEPGCNFGFWKDIDWGTKGEIELGIESNLGQIMKEKGITVSGVRVSRFHVIVEKGVLSKNRVYEIPNEETYEYDYDRKDIDCED